VITRTKASYAIAAACVLLLVGCSTTGEQAALTPAQSVVPTLIGSTIPAPTAAPTPSSSASASALAPGEFQRASDKPTGLFGTPVTRTGCATSDRFAVARPVDGQVTKLVLCSVDFADVGLDPNPVRVDPASADGRAVLTQLARPSRPPGGACQADLPYAPWSVIAVTVEGRSRLIVPTSFCGDQLPGAVAAISRARRG
jgi:hypothetical protein